jgi:hypothetical protein
VLGGLFDCLERGFELLEFVAGECAEVCALVGAEGFLDGW